MHYKSLGNTGLKVSEVAFGGVEIGMPYGLNMSQASHKMQKDDAIKLLHYALDRGINFFDTARLYGESESIMGEAFAGMRQDVILASKCKHFRLPDGSLPAAIELKKIMTDSLHESLRELRTDCIDVYMLHYGDLEILELEEVYELFSIFQQEGLIRYPGVSVYEPEETKKALDKDYWKVIQLPFNLMDQKQGEHFQQASAQGVGLVVRSVLMRGLLTDKSFQLHPALKDVQAHLHTYRKLYSEDSQTLASLAMKFAASIPEVSSVLVGFDKVEFVQEALSIFNGDYLNANDLKMAKSMSYPDQSFLNLAQWDKNGWL